MEISPAHKKGITIVVVGDPGTGKSTLIHAAASGTFPINVAHVLPPTRLPDDIFPDSVTVTVIDTSVQQRKKLEEEVRRADAIVVTYVAIEPMTRDRVITYWLHELRQLQVDLMCDEKLWKLDYVSPIMEQLPEIVWKLDYMSPIMEQFLEIDTCIECSACNYVQVKEVFYFATKAVLYPTLPLVDRYFRSLSPEFVSTLRRIFFLCDHDKDGSLSAEEFKDFQVKYLSTHLQPSEILDLNSLVQKRLPEGFNETGLTCDGFIFFHAVLIENWQTEIVWTVLRKFKYNNNLRLNVLLPPSFKCAPDQRVELTDDAIGFLKGFFDEYGYSEGGDFEPSTAPDCPRDEVDDFLLEGGDFEPSTAPDCPPDEVNGFLLEDDDFEPSNLEYLFYTAPDCPWYKGPYKNAAPVTEFLGYSTLTMDGFLSEWVLMTLLGPAKSLEYLKYLTYSGDASSAIRMTRRRRTDRKKRQSERNVYQCFVFGPKRAGKSALLDAFLERPFSDTYHANTEERYAVNVVTVPLGSKKFLVLREIPEDEVQMLLSDKESLAACDIAIFVYDSCDELSWKKTADFLVQVAGHGEDTGYGVPSLIVAAKAEINPLLVEVHESTRVSQEMGIEVPIPVNVKSGDLNDIFKRIVSCAQQPHLSIPKTEARRRRKQYHWLGDHPLMLVSVGAAVIVAGLVAYRKQQYNWKKLELRG